MGTVGILLVSFAIGAIPTANLFARATHGVDLRDVGGGTVSGSALYFLAGFVPLALAGILDIGKGAVGPLLAGTNRPVLAALAGGFAVAGHNWSPFLRGAGGRGIAPAMGALFVNAWVGALLLLAGLAVGRLVRKTGLVSFAAEVALVPVLSITNGREGAVAGLAVAIPLLLKRILGNSPATGDRARVYVHRLLFDHDPAPELP